MRTLHSIRPLATYTIGTQAAWLAATGLVILRQGKITFHGDEIAPYAQLSYFLMLTLVPLVSHWLTADLIDRLRPRLFLCSGSRHLFSVFIRGVIAGALSLLTAAALAPFLDPIMHGAFTVAACCIASSLLFVALSAKAKVNHCASCNYDLTSTPRNAPCPECGRTFSRVEFMPSLVPGAKCLAPLGSTAAYPITTASATESSPQLSSTLQSNAAHP